MKIDSIDKVTSFDSPVSEPLGNEDKSIMTTKKTAGLSDLNYTPYKPVNITGQAKKAYNYYLNRGVKPNVAAGIVGNLYKESGLNPMAVGDKGTAYGVAQWRGNRLSNLKNYASSKGRSYTDLNTQLDFILDEQGENQVLSLMSNQSPEEAAKTFADKYERPNPKYADYSTRSSVAKQLGQMKLGGFIPQLKKGGLIGTQKVADYQKMLNEKYGAGLSEDGAWGNKTEEAYKKYILNVDNNIPISRTQSNSKGNYNINTNTGDTLFVDKPKANIINNKLTPNVSDNIKLNSTTKNLPKKVIPIPINNSISSSSTVVNKPTIDEYKKKPITPKVDNSPKSPSFIDKAILAIQNPQSTWDNIINQFDKGNEKSNIKSKGIRAKENKPVTKSKSLTPTRPTFIYDYESEQKTPYRTKNSYHAPFTLDLSNNNNKKFDLVDASTFEKAKNHPELKNSKGIVINTFNEFGDVNDNNADVIQLKSDGSIDVGKRGSFKEGKFSKLNKIPLDLSDVDYIYDKDDKNYKIYSKKTKSEIPIYTSQKRNNLDEATDYGKYLGGKHILVSGKKKVLVNGSVKDFKNIADKLTKETGEPVSLYQLDNGAYNLPFMKSDNKLTREDIISHRNRHLTSGGVGLSLRAYKFGGVIPKHTLGAGEIMGLVSQGMNLGAGFIDSTNDPENPNIAKSAISGFLKGNAALPGIGGILGGIAGIRDAKKQRELFQKKKDIENRGVMDYFNIRSKGILDNYNTQGEQSSFYAKGGIPNPQYEVEHGEVIIGDDVKLTGGKQLASNLHKVVGKTHDQFNPNTVNGTGEDGQGGQFIFSNRLKLGGKTFAKLAEGVAKQKAKAEEMMSHNDYIFKNTGQANAEIADAKLMQLAQIQEMMKGETNALGQFKYGGHVPQFRPGGNPRAGAKIGGKVSMKIPSQYRGIKALEYVRKAAPNLTFEQLKSLVGKAGVTVDDLKTFAKNPVNRVATNVASQTATNVGRNLPAVITNTAVGNVGKQSFLGTAGKVLGAGAEGATKFLNHPVTWLAVGLSGDKSPTQKKPNEKPISPKVLANLQAQGFTPDKVNVNSKTNPNELTIPQRRALRNNIPLVKPFTPSTPQGTKKPSGNKLNLNIDRPTSIVDNSVRNQFNNLNPLSNKQINNSVKLPDLSNKVDASKVVPHIRKVDNTTGINENFSPVIGAALSGVNYFANQNMIDKYKTQTSATLLQNPNYQYFDRSGNARASVRGITNSVINNPFLNQGTKQVALANSMNVMNEVNQQELNRKQEYDRSYRGQQIETENRNAMILNQARQQTMQNENQKQGLRQDNLNNLFGNINTNLAEFQANKQQDKAMQYMSLPYFKRLGLLTKEQQAEFMKNLNSFLMGENELPKNKKGGRIKMKYC